MGVDETSFRRGQDYVSVFADLDRPRAVFATEGRKAEVFERFVDDLEAHGGASAQVKEVCQDMSEAYLAGALCQLPEAEITFDRYHVKAQQTMNTSDDVRRRQATRSRAATPHDISTRTLLRRPSRSLALALSAAAILAAGCGRAETSDRRPPSAEPGLSFKERMDRSHRGMEQPSRAATNAEPAEQTAGIGRPCSEAQDFDYYYLGRSFEGLELTTTDRNCEPPPKKIRAANGVVVYRKPSRINAVSYIYGSCDRKPDPESGVIEGGCLPPLSVSSHPACEQPHSLYSRYSSGGGPSMHHQHIRVRGAPAAVFQDGRPGKGQITRVEIYTGDATVLVAGLDRGLVTRAAGKLVAPARSSAGARDAVSDLPLPRRGAAEDDAKENPPC